LRPIVDELLAEHAQLRRDFAQAGSGGLDRAGVLRFAETLAAHIRKEERQLFEGMQKLMEPEELNSVGAFVEQTLSAAPEVCISPTEATLKSRNL
jgi:hemerythrin-like domain-containing protein